MFESIDAIYFTFLFLLSGYITQVVLEFVYPVTESEISLKLFLHYFFFSILVFLLTYPTIDYIQSTTINHSLGLLIIFGIVLVFSISIGIIRIWHVGFVINSKRLIKPIPTAWDKLFHDIETVFVKIHLSDNKEIYGCLDRSSYISDGKQKDPDILFTLCYVDDEGNWEKQETSTILIARSKIEYIRIINTN